MANKSPSAVQNLCNSRTSAHGELICRLPTKRISRERLEAATRCDGEIPEDIFEWWMAKNLEAFTYFARGKYTGRIKIGRSVDPWRRVRELESSNNGEEAELLLTLRGRHLERKYHNRFAAHADGNEWFDPAPEILAAIERLIMEGAHA